MLNAGLENTMFVCEVFVSEGAPGFEAEAGVRRHQSSNAPKCPPMGRTPGCFTEPASGGQQRLIQNQNTERYIQVPK
jgi:hypothetical protein